MLHRCPDHAAIGAVIFAGYLWFAAPVLGLPTSVCTANFTSCDVYEDGVVLQLPANAIAGDVVLRDADNSTSDVFRLFNNILDTGGGTGLGNQAFLYSADEGNLPSVLSTNALFVSEGIVTVGGLVETDVVGNGTTYRIFSGDLIAAPEPPMLALVSVAIALLWLSLRKRA
jgi:hypothetical protein